MAWRDTLTDLRNELADTRAQRLRQSKAEDAEAERARGVLSQLVDSLQIPQLLTELNEILLEGKGNLETFISWEEEDGEDEGNEPEKGFNLVSLNEEQEELDEIYMSLTWEENDERTIEVEVGNSEDEGLYLMVNGVSIRHEQAALEQALVVAFREELDL